VSPTTSAPGATSSGPLWSHAYLPACGCGCRATADSTPLCGPGSMAGAWSGQASRNSSRWTRRSSEPSVGSEYLTFIAKVKNGKVLGIFHFPTPNHWEIDLSETPDFDIEALDNNDIRSDPGDTVIEGNNQ